MDSVSVANVDFVSKTLTMEIFENTNFKSFIPKMEKIILGYESDIRIKEKEITHPSKKVMYLYDLDSTGFKDEIEDEIRRIEGIKSFSFDPLTSKLIIEANDGKLLPSILRKVKELIVTSNPEVEVSYVDKKSLAEGKSDNRKKLLNRSGHILGAILFFLALFISFPPTLDFSLFLISYVLVGGEVVLKAVKNISKGQIFDENFLMSVATIGAFLIGEYPEGVAVMLFYQVGEAIQKVAVNRSRKSITALMDIKPDYANLKTDKGVIKVAPEEVGIGELIVIKPGGKDSFRWCRIGRYIFS